MSTVQLNSNTASTYAGAPAVGERAYVRRLFANTQSLKFTPLNGVGVVAGVEHMVGLSFSSEPSSTQTTSDTSSPPTSSKPASTKDTH